MSFQFQHAALRGVIECMRVCVCVIFPFYKDNKCVHTLWNKWARSSPPLLLSGCWADATSRWTPPCWASGICRCEAWLSRQPHLHKRRWVFWLDQFKRASTGHTNARVNILNHSATQAGLEWTISKFALIVHVLNNPTAVTRHQTHKRRQSAHQVKLIAICRRWEHGGRYELMRITESNRQKWNIMFDHLASVLSRRKICMPLMFAFGRRLKDKKVCHYCTRKAS